MLYVKLNEKLKSELEMGNELVPWRELKQKLPGNDENYKELLKGCEFFSTNKVASTEGPRLKITSKSEYSRLINSKSANWSDIRQLRADLSELKRESTWLINCIFSSLGLAVVVYFCASLYFDKFELKIISAFMVGLVMFFIEVILYVIRSG